MTTYYVEADLIRDVDKSQSDEGALLAAHPHAAIFAGRVCAAVEWDKPTANWAEIIAMGEEIIDSKLAKGYRRSGKGGAGVEPHGLIVNE